MHIERPTPRIGRVVRARRGAVIAVTAVALAGLMSACGSSSTTSTATTTQNTAQDAQAIEETILAKRHIHATVVCPTGVPLEVGRTFECIATTRAAKPPHTVTKTPFVVTIQTSRGYATFQGK